MAAGAKDMLVLPELNALVGVWPEELTVEADVRDMPGVWVSADHQVLILLLCCSSALYSDGLLLDTSCVCKSPDLGIGLSTCCSSAQYVNGLFCDTACVCTSTYLGVGIINLQVARAKLLLSVLLFILLCTLIASFLSYSGDWDFVSRTCKEWPLILLEALAIDQHAVCTYASMTKQSTALTFGLTSCNAEHDLV